MSGEGLSVLQLSTQSLTASRFAAPFGRYLRARGHEVTLACSGRSFEDAPSQVARLRAEGFEVVEIDIPRQIEVAGDVAALYEALALMRDRGFDVVHTHNSKAGVIGRIAAALAGVPAVFHTNHGLAVEVADRYGRVEGRLHVLLERWMSRLTDLIFVVSEAERARALRWGVAPAARMVLVEQGIDPAFFSRRAVEADVGARLRARLGVGAGAALLGCVARLVREKELVTALEATALLVGRGLDVHLALVGEGPEREALYSRAEHLGIAPRVHLMGHLDLEEVRDVFASLDVFLLPSRWESFGVVLLEAMAMQVPVVASALPPLDGIVAHGTTGLLATVGDPAAFADATARLLADPMARTAMGQMGRHRVEAHYDETRMFARMEAAYLAAHRSRRT